MATPNPKFSDLPLQKDGPPLNAWGLYGHNDQLGTLNRLNDSTVVAAAREIQTGTRISLNWPLDAQNGSPLFNRQPFVQQMYRKAPRFVNDDTWSFNTQSSSQWDGLRHYADQKAERFYNGVTIEQIHEDGSTVNGVGAWSEQGIVGRGILVDVARWREVQSLEYNAFKSTSIPLAHLKGALEEQGTEVRFGDVLFVRSGFMKAYGEKSKEELAEIAKLSPPSLGGVEQSEEIVQWIWENFAAVAGDHPSFEAWPKQKDWSLHEVLLAGWGCPIGELFDLENLANHCSQSRRWSFFLTSEPCNVPGGVASPPNALAMF